MTDEVAPDEWDETENAPLHVLARRHDHKGHSEEMCIRCGWVMGRPPLNCQNDDSPHIFPSQQADDEIERLRGLVAELLPYALNDAEQGVSIGPPPEGNDFCQHCEQTCIDCEWYDQSLAFMERYNNGYYSID